MGATFSNQTGDGLTSVLITTNISLPDAGSSVGIAGTVSTPGNAPVTITGSPVTVPSPPGSGSIYFIIQINTSTGAATVKQSTSATPAPDAGNTTVFADILLPSNTDLALDPSESTPDTY